MRHQDIPAIAVQGTLVYSRVFSICMDAFMPCVVADSCEHRGCLWIKHVSRPCAIRRHVALSSVLSDWSAMMGPLTAALGSRRLAGKLRTALLQKFKPLCHACWRAADPPLLSI